MGGAGGPVNQREPVQSPAGLEMRYLRREGGKMTRRERAEARLERRREWAAGREQKADSLLKRDESIRHDWAFITQPGHIPERARVNARQDRAFEHLRVARHHEQKAAGTAHLLETKIFSDDPDALEALQARIAELEAQRDRMKTINRLYRKGDAAGLAALGKNLEKIREEMKSRYSWEQAGPYPPYSLQNLGGNITRLKKRIKEVEDRQKLAAEAEAAPGGVHIRGEDYVAVTFAEKPERAILEALKAAEFRWSGGSWCGYRSNLPESVKEMAVQS